MVPEQVMELMEGGNLWSALHGPRSEDFSWYERGQSIAMGIVRGLFYLHGKSSFSTSLRE